MEASFGIKGAPFRELGQNLEGGKGVGRRRIGKEIVMARQADRQADTQFVETLVVGRAEKREVVYGLNTTSERVCLRPAIS